MLHINRAVLITFALSLAAYLSTAAGYIDTMDADPSYELAKSLVERGSAHFHPAFPDSQLYADSQSHPGAFTSKLGLGMALVYVPAVIVAKWVAKFHLAAFDPTARFLISLVNSFVTAWIVALLFAHFLERGLTIPQAASLSFFAGFTTLLFNYSKTCHREPLQALLLLGMFVALHRRNFLAAAVCFGLGLNVKSMWIVPAFPAVLLGLYYAHQKRQLKRALVPGIPLMIGLLLYQWNCFGEPLKSGYNPLNVGLGGVMWSHSFFEGIWEQLFALQSGFWILNLPTLLCFGLFARRAVSGQLDFFDKAILASFFLQTAFYACWYTPLGGSALGPRYLVVTLPILFLAIRSSSDIPFLEKFQERRALAAAVLLCAFCFQLPQVAVKSQQYWEVRRLSGSVNLGTHWFFNMKAFAQKLRGEEEIYRVPTADGAAQNLDLRNVRSLRGFNFWWSHLLEHGVPL